MTMMQRSRILVVDDDRALMEALVTALESMGYEAVGEHDAILGLERVRSWQPDAAIFDYKMPEMDGVELTAKALSILPELPVILLTGFGTIQGAVQAMRGGVYDYVAKPFDLTEVEMTLQKALDHAAQRRRYQNLAEATGHVGEFEGIVGESPAIRAVRDAIAAVADTDSTVLVIGESGSGKELVARAIHTAGSRRDKPIITVDCAAIPDSLMESELFGHAKGAYTGAHKDRAGHFETADDGTVFLDEIGEIPLILQKKLLRVLEEKSFTRVGESRRRTTGARIVAATNRDLLTEVDAGRFREDLYYRLKVVEIRTPPLRDRAEDISLLVQYFLARLNRRLNRKTVSVTQAALDLLRQYRWPGNVRELANLLEQVMNFHNAAILDLPHFPAYLYANTVAPLPSLTYPEFKEQVLVETGRQYFAALMSHFRGNITQVAAFAGIDRRHIHRLLHAWGFDISSYRRS